MFQNEEKNKKKCMKIKCQRKFNDKTFINKWYLRLKNKFASKHKNKKEEAFTDDWFYNFIETIIFARNSQVYLHNK